jgi:hypothetical protein
LVTLPQERPPTVSLVQWTPRPNVVARPLGDVLVVVSLGANQIFELNRTGTRIWELRVAGRSAAETAALLAAEFGADTQTIAMDMAALERDLSTAGLIEVPDAG